MKLAYRILHFFILIICLVLQIGFIEHLKLYSINFDLIMVVLVAVSLIDGVLSGICYGFVAGILLNLMVGDIVGISAFIYVMDAFIASRLIEVGFRRKILSFVFIIFLITEINLIVTSTVYYLFNYNISISGSGLEMLAGPACNIILAFFIFPIIEIGTSREYEPGLWHKKKN